MLSILDDWFLVREAMNGNEQTFTEMFIRYWDYVYVVSKKMILSEEDAEEVAQDCFFLTKRYPFDETKCPRYATYLWRLARWAKDRNITYHRKRKKDFPGDMLYSLDYLAYEEGEPFANMVPDISPSPEDDLYAKELQDGVWEAYLKLKREMGAVFYLSYYKQLENYKIAEKLGKSVSNVNSLLLIARRRIKYLMCKEGYFKS